MKLELKSLSVRYGSGSNTLVAVDGVNLAVPSGSTLGLVGESGCGKSTVARAIVGLVPLAGGELWLDGTDITDLKLRNRPEFRRRVQMIFQNPFASLNPRMTVGDTLSDAIRQVAKRSRSEQRRELLRVIDLVGLPATSLERYPHQFSGGQQQRISIARALAIGPEVIVHDEVTSALDVSVQATILNLLKELQRELSLSYLFISHDLSTVRYVSQDIAVMYLGRIVESGPVDEVFSRPQHPYTQALLQSLPRFGALPGHAPLVADLPDPRHPPSGCRFRTRCPVGPLADPTRTICADVDPQREALGRSNNAACHFVDKPASDNDRPAPGGSPSPLSEAARPADGAESGSRARSGGAVGRQGPIDDQAHGLGS